MDEETRDRRRQMMGAAVLSTAGVMLGIAWIWSPPNVAGGLPLQGVLVGAVLAAAVVAAIQFPIYIRHNTKLCVSSIPLFLIAGLLPPALAGLVALLGVLIGETTVKAKRGNCMGDIATHAGRWGALALGASAIAHLPLAHSTLLQDGCLALGGVMLWAGDLLTLPLALVPLTGEPTARLLRTVVREGGLAEAAQYAIGLMGMLLASQQLWALALLLLPGALVYLTFRKELDADTLALLENLADSIDLRDPLLADHSRRVVTLVRGMLDELGMRGQEARQILAAARLHDLGKLDLPSQVLLKPGALTPEETLLVTAAPDRAVALLAAYPDFSRGVEMIRHHHERWDGTGYPDGLKGKEIPFGARVIAIADSFDALTAERSYRRALTEEQAAQILLDGRSRQWDPALVDVFLRSIASHLQDGFGTGSVDTAAPIPVMSAVEVTA